MRRFLMTAAALALSPFAVTGATWAAAPTTGSAASTQTENANSRNLRDDLKNMLQKAGYTDIRVAPVSFMVHAKGPNGNPVVMSISPDSFTEATVVKGSNANGANTGPSSGATNGAETKTLEH